MNLTTPRPSGAQVLLIRAYNTRPKDQTVSEQFSQYRRVNADGDEVLTREVRLRACVRADSRPAPSLSVRVRAGRTSKRPSG